MIARTQLLFVFGVDDYKVKQLDSTHGVVLPGVPVNHQLPERPDHQPQALTVELLRVWDTMNLYMKMVRGEDLSMIDWLKQNQLMYSCCEQLDAHKSINSINQFNSLKTQH